MPAIDLGLVWFLLVGVLLVGYAVLDGFDLGAGILHLVVAKTDDERRTVLNSIGPVWDGNEVWLLTAGGALFAAFPTVYATVFSGFYLALMLLLVALIFRAVSLEFRSKVESPRWRLAWDVAFSVGSFLPALLFGVALANILRGLPLGADGEYRGGLLGLLDPFTLVVGLLSVAMCIVHGASWLTYRTDGELHARAARVQRLAIPAYAALWVVASLLALVFAGDRFDAFANPLAWLAPAAFVVAAFAAWRWAGRPGSEVRALLASGASIAAMLAVVGVGLYPRLVPSTGAGADITVASARSSELTLTVMLVVALVGMPIVLAYTAWVYWRFRGKVGVEEHGY